MAAVSAAKRQKRAEPDTVTQLQVNRDTNVDAKGMGPRRVRTHRSAWFVHPAVLVQALKCLDMGAGWQENARQDAILDSCARSLPSVKSGLLAYAAFVGTCVSPLLAALLGHRCLQTRPSREQPADFHRAWSGCRSGARSSGSAGAVTCCCACPSCVQAPRHFCQLLWICTNWLLADGGGG